MHQVSEDYASIPNDLVSLGFVPPNREAALQEAGVVRVLSNVLRQLSSGGGAAKIDMEGLISELREMTRSYGNLFQIPPYFAYILRAFTVLEGIGLSSDPDYAIVQECYPTLAQRLFVVSAALVTTPIHFVPLVTPPPSLSPSLTLPWLWQPFTRL